MELARKKDKCVGLKEEARLAQVVVKERELVHMYFTVVTQSLLASSIKIPKPPAEMFATNSPATLVAYVFLFNF